MTVKIQRNTNVSPVPIQTPIFEHERVQTFQFGSSPDKSIGPNAPARSGSPTPMSYAWTKYHQELNAAVNAAPQIAQNPPILPTSSGTLGDVAFDTSYIYVCIGENKWMRAPLATW